MLLNGADSLEDRVEVVMKKEGIDSKVMKPGSTEVHNKSLFILPIWE